jgi:hypothetical protein
MVREVPVIRAEASEARKRNRAHEVLGLADAAERDARDGAGVELGLGEERPSACG